MEKDSTLEQYKYLFDDMVDFALAKEKDGYTNKLESFEQHKNRIKIEFFDGVDEYFNHLKHGYNVIIEEIKSYKKL